ncbi:MAG: hypothetical protein WBG53_23215, partial [Rhodococcus sp. (in: high G+C Gram-positive bacteria)]
MTSTDDDGGWWSSLPLDRVVRLHGATERELAESVNPLPSDSPSIVFFAVDPTTASRAVDLVDAVVAELENAAVDSIPLLLTELDHHEGSSTLDRRAARVAA